MEITTDGIDKWNKRNSIPFKSIATLCVIGKEENKRFEMLDYIESEIKIRRVDMNVIFNADKSSRNLFGTQNKVTSWSHPPSGPPKVSTWFKIRSKFDLTRPTTILTKEAWLNRPIGPPNAQIPSNKEVGHGYINGAPNFNNELLIESGT